MMLVRYDYLIKFVELCNSWVWVFVLLLEKIIVNRGFMIFMLYIFYLYFEIVYWDFKVFGMFWL